MQITEIHFDPPGSDSGREWIEIYNGGPNNEDNAASSAIAIKDIFVKEAGVRHKVSLPDTAAITEMVDVPVGAYIVIADNAAKMRVDYPDFNGIILESAFSLKNDGEPIELMVGANSVDVVNWDEAMADLVAQKNKALSNEVIPRGYSLQRDGGVWVVEATTPGAGISLIKKDSIQESIVSSPLQNQIDFAASANDSDLLAAKQEKEIQIQGGLGGSGGMSTRVGLSVIDKYPDEPQIFASIVSPSDEKNTLFAGVTSVFSGNAYGLKKEPLSNARYIWNFGDGTTTEGKSVVHIFNSPGNYTVSLQVTSGEWSAVDNVSIVVLPTDFSFEVLSLFTRDESQIVGVIGEGSIAECRLINNSKYIVDISGFLVRNNVATTTFSSIAFVFPQNSLIAARATVALPKHACSGDLRAPNDSVVEPLELKWKEAGVEQNKKNSQSIVVKKPVKTKATNIESVINTEDPGSLTKNNADSRTGNTTSTPSVIAYANNALAERPLGTRNMRTTLWVLIGGAAILASILYWKKATFGI